MSETSGGPGWWLASDGRFYPPELSPGPSVPTATPSPGGESASTIPPGPGSWGVPTAASSPDYLPMGSDPRPGRPPFQKVIFGVAIAIIVGALAVGVVSALTAKPLHQTATTTGTVLSCDDASAQNIVRYQVNGATYTTTADQSRSPYCPYAVGQTVTVHYNPVDPASASVHQPGTPTAFVVIIVFIATASLLVGTISVVRRRKGA